MDGKASPLLATDGPSWDRTEGVVIFRFQVIGTARPKARPRFRRVGDYVQTYTPETTVTWEQNVVAQVKQALARLAVTVPTEELALMPFSGRIVADVRVNCARPKSAPKSVVYPMKATPGDIDNLAKSVLDALQLARVIEDDKTVTDLTAYKRFADDTHAEGVEVELIAFL